jgi:hypothetical protein
MLTSRFITAGRAIFTVAIPQSFHDAMAAKYPRSEPPHLWYTYRVRYKPASDQWPEAWFVDLLAGPNNTTDYKFLGKLNKATGAVALTTRSHFTDNAWPVRVLRRALAVVWSDDDAAMTTAGFAIHHEGRCGRCGRVLTTPHSVQLGLGPECASY